MRRAVLLTAAAVLLACPTVLAFFSGGYFDEPRLIATLVIWALVLVVALGSPWPLPGSWGGRLALAGIALLTAWTAASIAWAPLSSPATDSVVRLLLYAGALTAAAALLRDPVAARGVEPILALGAVVVIGYGLSERLLPGLIELARSVKADGRLEQPLTYWNAEGALAAIGLVLCVRLAGSDSRRPSLRVTAAAGSVPLAVGVYLSYSRGAMAAAAIGLIVLLALAPSWPQLRAVGVTVAAGILAAAAASFLPGVASLDGSLAERETDGGLMLAILALAMAAAGLAQARAARAERGGGVVGGRLGIAGRLPVVAALAVVVGLAGLVAGGLGEKGREDELSKRRGASRLTSVHSRRYDYWRIGVSAFRRHPLEGLGAGGFRVVWLRDRPVAEGALEVHSLPLEMAAELGIPGLIGLALLLGGVGGAGREALRRRPGLAAGAGAAATVWVLHAAIDWDWQLPAVTLPALILGGALIAAGDSEPDGSAPEATGRREQPNAGVPASA